MAGSHFRPGDQFKLTGDRIKVLWRWNGKEWVDAVGSWMMSAGKPLEEENVVVEIVKFMHNYSNVHIQWVDTKSELVVDWISFLDNADPITL